MLLTKRSHEYTIFQTFSALMKVLPVTHVIFGATRSGFIQILCHCSVSWKIILLCFLAQTSYALDRNIWNISQVIFETTSQYFFKLCITLQYHEREPFLAETLYDFDKKSPSKCKTSDFQLLRWNFIKLVLW